MQKSKKMWWTDVKTSKFITITSTIHNFYFNLLGIGLFRICFVLPSYLATQHGDANMDEIFWNKRNLDKGLSQEFYYINKIMISEGIMDEIDK